MYVSLRTADRVETIRKTLSELRTEDILMGSLQLRRVSVLAVRYRKR